LAEGDPAGEDNVKRRVRARVSQANPPRDDAGGDCGHDDGDAEQEADARMALPVTHAHR